MRPTRSEHPLHSMSTYIGSFPPRVPRRIMSDWVPARATVLDPFCGSGTTLLEAKLLGHPTIGIDLNPLAITLSSAKLQSVELEDVLFRIRELARAFPGIRALEEVPDRVRMIFHERTLSQLCYLRSALDGSNPEDVFLRGAVLGIMHGKSRSDGSTAYLSVDMPNTFSMSPGYVKRFIAARSLKPPLVDVFSKLRERSSWLLRDGSPPDCPPAAVIHGDATRASHILDSLGRRSVGAIVTSPPYLGVLRYGAFNWIRLWFLRRDQYGVDDALDSTDSLDTYLSFVISFFKEAAKVLRPGGLLILVIGDVAENGQYLPLAERLWEETGDLVPFDLESILDDDYDQSSKTTRIWGEDRKGRAGRGDKTLVLRRARARSAVRTAAETRS